MILSFGESEHERIEIDVLTYERQPKGDYWDDNWVSVKIYVTAAGFHGDVSASIRTDELQRFLEELCRLYKTLQGIAEFKTLEHQLSLRLIPDTTGHIELCGELADRYLQKNRLKFVLSFDQTYLAKSIQELEKIMIKFPVRESKR